LFADIRACWSSGSGAAGRHRRDYRATTPFRCLTRFLRLFAPCVRARALRREFVKVGDVFPRPTSVLSVFVARISTSWTCLCRTLRRVLLWQFLLSEKNPEEKKSLRRWNKGSLLSPHLSPHLSLSLSAGFSDAHFLRSPVTPGYDPDTDTCGPLENTTAHPWAVFVAEPWSVSGSSTCLPFREKRRPEALSCGRSVRLVSCVLHCPGRCLVGSDGRSGGLDVCLLLPVS
jgi:hypothetical protein